jgi:hypothetical protein
MIWAISCCSDVLYDVRIRHDNKSITIDKHKPILIKVAIVIDLGAVRLLTLSAEEQASYKRNAEAFSEVVVAARPHPNRFQEALTSTIRFGEKGVYQAEESTGKGGFAEVMKVKEIRSGAVFAAKEPHYNISDSAAEVRMREESVRSEFRKIMRLKHVSVIIHHKR